ncbi:hypothetical protein CMU59_09880 [Elizabethkingia anophelis]|uniref:hypothetical protein n=1 Tax=Elizabethkingia anophelis TaxID=1117645 RepID=UPI0020113E87|nr:hypothetical protein [Elizabethkingia anophelis]MCL1688849.1 hypothetical protein [Elizabethkingia anophelis]MDV3574019.1 hypothetical protein [Elizabethkingia anophelis]MDV3600735.1 hypothetical protein [Elizabethkingia anophelis]MDV3606899.1 hypothetical protein [Elizabethkingia anophelis]MDV3638950.1 hypothetical protein [Elizabethkingia anophelis]
MKTVGLRSLFMLTSFMACAQEKNDNPTLISSKMKTINSVPFLTRQNDFVYVDKTSLKPVIEQKFKTASLFTATGFAIVGNEKNESAVIDERGKIVLEFSEDEINVNVINGLTFYKKEIEYEKKMPSSKWDWNIMGSNIKKEQTYHKVEIGVLETKQILLSEDVPYLEDEYSLNFISVDENHVFWNGSLYEIKKNHINKVEDNIIELLENKRFIKASNSSFSVYGLNQKKAIYNGLEGTETLSIRFGNETITLKEVNKERFDPEVPKLLTDSKTNDVYAFPQYEKVFPKEITKATASQIDFIKKASLVYSITNSPYFLLGIFNYDNDVWAYDWLYIDIKGNVTDSIDTYNFKVLDQVGYLVWPDRKMILPNQFNDKNWKFGKISYYRGMDDLYLIRIEDGKQQKNMGLWNSRTKSWEIKPECHSISVLDTEHQIYALQKEKDGLYILYDNKNKKNIGLKSYKSVNSDGLVNIKTDSGQNIYYYIDIYSGREYKE